MGEKKERETQAPPKEKCLKFDSSPPRRKEREEDSITFWPFPRVRITSQHSLSPLRKAKQRSFSFPSYLSIRPQIRPPPARGGKILNLSPARQPTISHIAAKREEGKPPFLPPFTQTTNLPPTPHLPTQQKLNPLSPLIVFKLTACQLPCRRRRKYSLGPPEEKKSFSLHARLMMMLLLLFLLLRPFFHFGSLLPTQEEC